MLRNCLSVALWLLIASIGMSQTLVVDTSKAGEGRYWIEVSVGADGTVSAKVVDNSNIVVLPAGPGGPVDPGELEGLAKVALAAKATVTADPQKDKSSATLSVLYQTLSTKIGTAIEKQPGDAPWQKLADVTKQSKALLLGSSSEAWAGWDQAIAKALAAMEAANKLDDEAQMRAAYEDIAEGLVADLSRENLDPAWIELILKIVELLLQLLG